MEYFVFCSSSFRFCEEPSIFFIVLRTESVVFSVILHSSRLFTSFAELALCPKFGRQHTGDIARDNPEVKTSVYGFNRTGKGTNVGRSAFMLNVGANWMFDSTWSVGAFYTLEARSKQVNQSVNAAIRCCF